MKIVCTNCGRTDQMPLPVNEDRTVDGLMLDAVIKERDWEVGLPGLEEIDGISYWPPHSYGQIKLCPDCRKL